MEKKYIDMGCVGMHPRGAYDVSVTYSRLQIVTHGGNTYLSKQDGNVGHVPVGEDDWWSLMVDAKSAHDGAQSAQEAAEAANAAAQTANDKAAIAAKAAESVTTATAGLQAALDKVDAAATAATSASASAQAQASRAQEAAERGESLNLQLDDTLKAAKAEVEAAKTFNATAARNEGQRVTDEGERVTAEQNRSNAEGVRTGNEETRTRAEQQRSNDEKLRAEAEARRMANEKLRVASEQERADASQQAVMNAQQAATAANTAADAANKGADKVSDAVTAAGNVNATLADDGTLTVTDRNGESKSVKVGEGEKVQQLVTDMKETKEAVAQNAADISGVQKRLDMFGDAFVGFARVSGDADPKPSADYIYGTRKLVQEIGKHMKLGTVKRVDNDAVLQHECAKGRITLANNGDAVTGDGTEGDLLVYTDIPLYMLKANEQTDGSEMSCMGVGVSPFYWQGHAAKKLEPFAMSPFYTVQTKLAGDERSCAHNVISDDVVGSYQAPNGFLKESFRENGSGYYSTSVSTINSMLNAQAKNADPNTNYPYMGCYYEFYELWLMMMFAECGTLDTTDLYCMGVGCTQQETANVDTWNNERIAANSGLKIFASTGAEVKYLGLNTNGLKKGQEGSQQSAYSALVGAYYVPFTKCGEVLSVLDGVTKAGLQSEVGARTHVFHFDADGALQCAKDGSIDLDTGLGMVSNKRYYIIRDVPNCQGIADGVMTAVVNCYVKMNVADGIYIDNTDLTGGYVIYKFSHSVYRGLSMPMDGHLFQLCGAYYTTECREGQYYNKYHCAEKWSDMPPLVNKSCYTDIESAYKLDVLKGLHKRCDVAVIGGWISKADYSYSLFCKTEATAASSHSKECCYLWCGNTIWGEGKDGKPEEGKLGVKAFAVGCSANNDYASSRSADSVYACSLRFAFYAGALAVPQLKLKQ